MFFKKKFNYFRGVALILGVLAMSFSFSYFVFGFWSEPTDAPPGGGSALAPLNISSTDQTKAGGLILNSGGASINGLIVQSGKVGIGALNPDSKLQVTDGAVLFDGILGGTPIAGAGTRMMWIPAKAAFRAGKISPLQSDWDDLNIGDNSIAFGNSTTASGAGSTAMGSFTIASEAGSTAMGFSTIASGIYSIAAGRNTTASGLISTAMGSNTVAGGTISTAMGSKIIVGDTGTYSFGIGLDHINRTITLPNTMAIMGGNVGIGTVSPGRKLEVVGDASISNNLLTQTKGGLYYGRVGIKENQLALANIGVNWIPRDSVRGWSAIAMSSDGKYQTAAESSPGLIYISSNYGVVWTPIAGSSANWRGIAMSSDGKYQTAISTLSEMIYISSNYGKNWTLGAYTERWTGIAMSSDGKYQTATSTVSVAGVPGKIYTSVDYGISWAVVGLPENWSGVAISSDGKYQTATANGANIYISDDYGASWITRDSIRDWIGVAMSSDGKYQTAIVNNGWLYISADYGVSWMQKCSALKWKSIAMSSDGNYQVAVARNEQIYISIDWGENWTPKGLSKSWTGIAMSSDGKYQTAVASASQIYTSYSDSYVPGGNFGIGAVNPISKLQVTDGAVLFSGVIGDTPIAGGGTRMMWIPAKAAFRAGKVSDVEWNNANIGDVSIALGQMTIASGFASTAIGNDTVASGLASTAIGNDTVASGFASTAMGSLTTASAQVSFAAGALTTASGDFSTAMGRNIAVSNTGTYSFGIGLDDEARTITQPSTMAIMGGKVGIGTVNPQGALDVSSTTGALVVPRMTTVQRTALTAVNGMIIYNTTENTFNFYENGAWVSKANN